MALMDKAQNVATAFNNGQDNYVAIPRKEHNSYHFQINDNDGNQFGDFPIAISRLLPQQILDKLCDAINIEPIKMDYEELPQEEENPNPYMYEPDQPDEPEQPQDETMGDQETPQDQDWLINIINKINDNHKDYHYELLYLGSYMFEIQTTDDHTVISRFLFPYAKYLDKHGPTKTIVKLHDKFQKIIRQEGYQLYHKLGAEDVALEYRGLNGSVKFLMDKNNKKKGLHLIAQIKKHGIHGLDAQQRALVDLTEQQIKKNGKPSKETLDQLAESLLTAEREDTIRKHSKKAGYVTSSSKQDLLRNLKQTGHGQKGGFLTALLPLLPAIIPAITAGINGIASLFKKKGSGVSEEQIMNGAGQYLNDNIKQIKQLYDNIKNRHGETSPEMNKLAKNIVKQIKLNLKV